MPIYNFSCPQGHFSEAYVPSSTSIKKCDLCGEEMEKVWSVPVAGGKGFPFTTKNFNGKPITVESESHLKRLCTQFGVTHRPDAAWTTKKFTGVDLKTRKPSYSEGSGVGEKGCWV